MIRTFLVLLTFFSVAHVQAQYYMTEVELSAGAGITVPYDNLGYFGMGIHAQGEYVLNVNDHMDLRPYAAYILTKMHGDMLGSYNAEDKAVANAILFGGKARFKYPMGWVTPYTEIGVGGSIGSFKTITVSTNIDENGVYAHIPFSLGVELGPQQKVNVELTSYFHTGVQQFTAAVAIGLRFPVGYY